MTEKSRNRFDIAKSRFCISTSRFIDTVRHFVFQLLDFYTLEFLVFWLYFSGFRFKIFSEFSIYFRSFIFFRLFDLFDFAIFLLFCLFFDFQVFFEKCRKNSISKVERTKNRKVVIWELPYIWTDLFDVLMLQDKHLVDDLLV